jgi:DNA repair exonuclease SbcCD ATPase subunit
MGTGGGKTARQAAERAADATRAAAERIRKQQQDAADKLAAEQQRAEELAAKIKAEQNAKKKAELQAELAQVQQNIRDQEEEIRRKQLEIERLIREEEARRAIWKRKNDELDRFLEKRRQLEAVRETLEKIIATLDEKHGSDSFIGSIPSVTDFEAFSVIEPMAQDSSLTNKGLQHSLLLSGADKEFATTKCSTFNEQHNKNIDSEEIKTAELENKLDTINNKLSNNNCHIEKDCSILNDPIISYNQEIIAETQTLIDKLNEYAKLTDLNNPNNKAGPVAREVTTKLNNTIISEDSIMVTEGFHSGNSGTPGSPYQYEYLKTNKDDIIPIDDMKTTNMKNRKLRQEFKIKRKEIEGTLDSIHMEQSNYVDNSVFTNVFMTIGATCMLYYLFIGLRK